MKCIVCGEPRSAKHLHCDRCRAGKHQEQTHGCAEDVVMPFGKHDGKTLGWIAANDLMYLDWLAGADIRSRRLRRSIDAVARKYAHEIRSVVESED